MVQFLLRFLHCCCHLYSHQKICHRPAAGVSDTCVLLCVFIHTTVYLLESWCLCLIVQLFPSHLSKVHHASFFNSFLRSVLNYCDTFNIEETNIWYLWFILFLHKDQFSFAIFIYYFIWVILFYYVSWSVFLKEKWFKFKKEKEIDLDYLITEFIGI